MLLTYESFRDVPLPWADPSEPLGSWPVRSTYTDISSGGAFRTNGTAISAKATRTIRRTGMLLESDLAALRVAFGLLEAQAGLSGRLVGLLDNGRRVWTTAELTSVEAVAQPREVFRFKQYVALEVDTEFLLNTPAWYHETPGYLGATYFFDLAGTTSIPTTGAQMDAPDTTSTLLLVNDGNIPTARVRFEVTAGTGTVTASTFNNTTTGHVLAWNSPAAPALTAGQVLVIDSGAERVTVNGVGTWAGLTEPSNKERWFVLAPGDNVIVWTRTDSTNDNTTRLQVFYEHASA